MEKLGNMVSELTKTFSESPQISTPTITTSLSREQHAALFAVINKSRLLNGWTTRTAKELDPTIRTWAETFARYNIPISAYNELYQRAFDVRQSKLQTGAVPPMFDATLLVSQWTGNFGLQSELRQREVETGRTLTANAETVCQHCNGSGFKTVIEGNYRNAVKCDHSD